MRLDQRLAQPHAPEQIVQEARARVLPAGEREDLHRLVDAVEDLLRVLRERIDLGWREVDARVVVVADRHQHREASEQAEDVQHQVRVVLEGVHRRPRQRRDSRERSVSVEKKAAKRMKYRASVESITPLVKFEK